MSVLEKLEPVDIVAFIVLVGGLILISLHIDGIVGGAVTLIVGYYFGHKRKKENGKI